MWTLKVGTALVILVIFAVGCGGEGSSSDGSGRTTSADTAAEDQGAESPEEAINTVVSQWAKAYATGDVAYCRYERDKYQNLCENYLAGGKPTVYQTGYLNASAEKIALEGKRGMVTLSNGCKVEVAEEGKGDWRVIDSGGDLAKGCEQGTGR